MDQTEYVKSRCWISKCVQQLPWPKQSCRVVVHVNNCGQYYCIVLYCIVLITAQKPP